MGVVVSVIFLFPASIALFLSVFLALEVLASLFPRRRAGADQPPAGPIAVVIPAHNESATIATTLENVRMQTRSIDRVLVVADNCTDDTAAIARQFGMDVVERNDPARRGKGYALQFGLDALRAAPPEIVVFTDADCVYAPGALQRIAALCAQSRRPVQALYLMRAPVDDAHPRLHVAEFAWLFINQVRMRGLQRLFDVTRFTGAGLAAPWHSLENVDLGTGEIVEDLAFTYSLVRNGKGPVLADDALIESTFPVDEAALTRQAARWSIGSLRYAVTSSISLLIEGIAKANLRLGAAAIDLMIPPLTIFVMALFVLTFVSAGVWAATGSALSFLLSLWSLALTGGAVILGWLRFGRERLPVSALGGVLRFVLSKFSVFGAGGRESTKGWTPTRDSRDGDV